MLVTTVGRANTIVLERLLNNWLRGECPNSGPSEVFGLKLNINYRLNFLTQTLVTRDLLGRKTACTILLLEIRRSNITYIDVSYSLAICYRVPRGSILGLTPFVICTNDLSQSLMKSSIGMYADDTIIYFFDANAEIIKWLL